MGNRYIRVGSITNAMYGKRLLEQQGITAYIHKDSVPREGDGCGYSLLVTKDSDRAEQILRNRGVRIVRISDAL